MPIYEYYCEKCQYEFEELVFGDDTPPCPQCGVAQTQKLMSRPCLHSGHASNSGAEQGAASAAPKSKCSGCSGGNCANC